MRPTVPVAPAPLAAFPPGETVQDAVGGDFFLSFGHHVESWAIRAAQGVRFRGPDRIYARYNHAGIFVDDQGGIVEVVPRGAVRANISRYANREYTVVHTGAIADANDRKEMVAFALEATRRRLRFAWVTMAVNGVNILLGTHVAIGISGRTVCSGLVARCLERSSMIFPAEIDGVEVNVEADTILPADLARMFHVRALT
jgi:hypothetical protein